MRYYFVMKWTDQIRRVKILLVVAAVLIAVVSLVVSHFLVRDLYTEERNRMEVWAEAMRSFNNADETTDLNLVLKVINENHTIPVIVMDSSGKATTFRNVEMHATDYADSLRQATLIGKTLQEKGRVIKIDLTSGDELDNNDVKSFNDNAENAGEQDFISVCYDDSIMLKRLSRWPYIQLGVVVIFVVVAIFALLTSKRAEQNKVWVGLSKETAHQLGTPISSLMAWTEILRETYPKDTLIPEMENDVRRLQLIADRFSKIGSLPEPVPTNLKEVMDHVVDYMNRRTSQKVEMIKDFPRHDVIVRLNSSLFEWVIENLCKNAVDAMEGSGRIVLHIEALTDRVVVEVSDNGKGIRKKDIANVFRPGFTTKQRGWGLGLSLAKRIVEEYHHGRIFVKSSELGKGTTFRIELKV